MRVQIFDTIIDERIHVRVNMRRGRRAPIEDENLNQRDELAPCILIEPSMLRAVRIFVPTTAIEFTIGFAFRYAPDIYSEGDPDLQEYLFEDGTPNFGGWDIPVSQERSIELFPMWTGMLPGRKPDSMHAQFFKMISPASGLIYPDGAPLALSCSQGFEGGPRVTLVLSVQREITI